MARYNAGLNILPTLSNGRYILQLAATVFAARAWFAGLVRLAQQLDQIRSQATTWIRINIRVDGFMAHMFVGGIRVHALQHASRLLRRPAFLHQSFPFSPQFGRSRQLLCRTVSWFCTAGVRLVRRIAARSTLLNRIAVNLPPDRAMRPFKQASYSPPAVYSTGLPQPSLVSVAKGPASALSGPQAGTAGQSADPIFAAIAAHR